MPSRVWYSAVSRVANCDALRRLRRSYSAGTPHSPQQPSTRQWPAGSPIVCSRRCPSEQCAVGESGSEHAARCHSVRTLSRSLMRTTARQAGRRPPVAGARTAVRSRANLAVSCASWISSDDGLFGPPPLGANITAEASQRTAQATALSDCTLKLCRSRRADDACGRRDSRQPDQRDRQ